MMYNADSAPLWGLFPNKRYDAEFARMASPASYVLAEDPPMLIVHGQKDELVPPGQASAFAESLRKAGVRIKLRLDAEHGHDVMNAESIDEGIRFFTGVLKPGRSWS